MDNRESDESLAKDLEFLQSLDTVILQDETESPTVFNALETLGIDLAEEQRNIIVNPEGDTEIVDLRNESQGSELAAGDLEALNGVVPGVPNLGSLLASLASRGSQIIGIGPGQSMTIQI